MLQYLLRHLLLLVCVFRVSIDNFKHALYAFLLPLSLNGLDKSTWLNPFESTDFVFLSLNSPLKFITSTLKQGFIQLKYLGLFSKDLVCI